MRVFVINLEKDIQRRENIRTQLESLNMEFDFQNAVYGKNLNAEEMAASYNDNKAKRHQCRSLVSAEIGCALSHVRVYENIIKEKIPCACILEDDVILPDNFISVLNKLEIKLNNLIPQVILLSPAIYKENAAIQIDENYQLKQYKSGYYTSSYIVNQAAAKTLFKELFPVNDVADCWKRLVKHKLVDIKVVIPTLVNQDQDTFGSSTTDDIQKTYSYNKIQKLKFKFCRVFWLSMDGLLALYHRNIKPYGGIKKKQ